MVMTTDSGAACLLEFVSVCYKRFGTRFGVVRFVKLKIQQLLAPFCFIYICMHGSLWIMALPNFLCSPRVALCTSSNQFDLSCQVNQVSCTFCTSFPFHIHEILPRSFSLSLSISLTNQNEVWPSVSFLINMSIPVVPWRWWWFWIERRQRNLNQ